MSTLASLAVARRKENVALLGETRHDIVVVDEAHHLKDRASQSYKLVDALNKAKPASSKGVYLRKVAVSSTMGLGVRVATPLSVAGGVSTTFDIAGSGGIQVSPSFTVDGALGSTGTSMAGPSPPPPPRRRLAR